MVSPSVARFQLENIEDGCHLTNGLVGLVCRAPFIAPTVFGKNCLFYREGDGMRNRTEVDVTSTVGKEL